MKLINAKVNYYRSVENLEKFEIEPDVTCLVGNESGKTTVLQALYRLNPVVAVALDEVVDFPAKLTRRRRDWRPNQRIPVIIEQWRARLSGQACPRGFTPHSLSISMISNGHEPELGG